MSSKAPWVLLIGTIFAIIFLLILNSSNLEDTRYDSRDYVVIEETLAL